ncbi:MAG: SDR family NAD(P)-dependent oxidoreductase [bacterium]|nr:SDR family NAD(P)-dependent oxidoreductase [bacterium]
MHQHLRDRVAWITGGASGIGAATAMRFAAEGARLALSDVNPESLEAISKELDVEIYTTVADVSKKADVDAAVKGIIGKFGRLDLLICNAGINRDGLALKMSEEKWDLVLDINLKGTFLSCQAAMGPMMDARSGRIVTTASVGALGNIGQVNYSASKAGVIGLTKTLALELARFGITVNCVAPGATDTAMLKSVPDKIREGMMKEIPLRRFAEASDIASAHLFFCSEDAAYITGQVLFVDGGMSTGI